MDPITIAMLGMGAANMFGNLSREKRDAQLASATQRYSPWTGLKANPIERANPMGDLAQAGAGALAYNQMDQMSQAQQKLVQAQLAAQTAKAAPAVSPMQGGGAGPMSLSGPSSSYTPWADAMRGRQYDYF